ncbi:hypothetical protein [Pengzhenrongella phosphoraccumulans]|uniref:hypothetical protein n=1 Tax=Pengzhenrongella phosphoraccumulans TaxID=3114394 RepID=UPI003890188A
MVKINVDPMRQPVTNINNYSDRRHRTEGLTDPHTTVLAVDHMRLEAPLLRESPSGGLSTGHQRVDVVHRSHGGYCHRSSSRASVTGMHHNAVSQRDDRFVLRKLRSHHRLLPLRCTPAGKDTPFEVAGGALPTTASGIALLASTSRK